MKSKEKYACKLHDATIVLFFFGQNATSVLIYTKIVFLFRISSKKNQCSYFLGFLKSYIYLIFHFFMLIVHTKKLVGFYMRSCSCFFSHYTRPHTATYTSQPQFFKIQILCQQNEKSIYLYSDITLNIRISFQME